MTGLDAVRARLEEVVRSAGPIALAHFGRSEARWKADESPVTDADVAVERHLVDALGVAFPEDGVVSEEGGRRESRSGAIWYVDPIDGTSAFVQGLAHWGPTACRVHPERGFDVGAFFVPLLGAMWSGALGHGAFFNGARMPAMPDRPCGRRDFLFVPSRIHRWPGLPWPGKVRALGSTAAHLALVAQGAGSATIIPRWSRWDVGCGVILAREVGLLIHNRYGETVDPAVCSEGLPLLVGAPTALEILESGGWARSAGTDTASGA
jgi:myo-inositol-1(or 4)-monophosphatase